MFTCLFAKKNDIEKERISLVIEAPTSTTELVKLCLGRFRQGSFLEYPVREVRAHDVSVNNLAVGINLFVRFADPASIERVKELVAYKIPFGYLIDDNFWMLQGTSPLDKFYQDPFVRSSLELAVSKANIVYCHTNIFKNFLCKFNPNVVVLPTFFDFSCIDDNSFSAVDAVDNEVRIGIVANASRAKDLGLISSAIISILENSKSNIFFEFFGYMPEELRGRPRVRYFQGNSDYRTFIRMQYERSWLIGLAPLIQTPFSVFKTNNKFREFGACGTAGIYSDVSIYRDCVVHGENGWLVKDTKEDWVRAIELAISSPDKTKALGIEATRQVRRDFALENVKDIWFDALAPLLKAHRYTSFRGHLRRLIQRYKPDLLRDDALLLEARPAISLRWILTRIGIAFPKIVIVLAKGDSINSSTTAPIDGPFIWTIVLATFGTKPSGKLLIEVPSRDPARAVLRNVCNEELIDGGHIKLDVQLSGSELVNIRFKNDTNQNLGFYLLTSRDETRFLSTNHVVKGRIFA